MQKLVKKVTVSFVFHFKEKQGGKKKKKRIQWERK